MSWKVLITARTITEVGARALEILREAGCEVIIPDKLGPLPADAIQKLLPGIDAALVSPDGYNAAVLASPEAAQLKVISRWGVGYDSIDIPAATRLGIVVAYTPGMLDETVADYTWALLLGIARRIHAGHLGMIAGQWAPSWGHDVFGKTLGVIGCGRIGQAVVRRAAGFGMRVLSYDVFPNPNAEKLGVKFVPLDELLEQSDFVSLHAASTPANRGMLGEAQFRKMKKASYLINAGRGALLDEAALVKALTEGWIAGAALDTFIQEPMAAEHPFRTTPNLLIAPHQASFARETGERVSNAAAQAIVDLMQGRKPQLLVNPEVLTSPAARVKVN